MAGLPEVVLPLALGGALVAGDLARRRRDGAADGRGRPVRTTATAAAGRPLGAAARPAPAARRRRPALLPGRLLLGVLPGVARVVGPGGRDGPVPGRGRARPRAGRRRAWPSRPSSAGTAPSWPPASRAISSGTRWGHGRVWARCGASTRRAAPGARPSTWSPLTGCGEWREACRAAAELCEAAKGEGTTADGEFWYATAAKLLAPLFVAAALDGRTMADVVRWVDTQEVGEVAAILERAAPPEVLHAAQATWCRDDRTRSSIYTTAETVLAPFAHPPPGPPADAPSSPAICCGGAHTLYLCAPAHDQRRLRGYFTALTQQVLAHAFDRRHEVRPAARPAAPRRARRGGAHRPAARARRAGRDLRVARDPDRHDLAGPGPGQGPLRRAGADRAQQPPGQAVPARASPTPTRSTTPAG